MTFISHHTISRSERDAHRRQKRNWREIIVSEEVRSHVYSTKGDGCCGYCGDKLVEGESAIDHMIPSNRGGTNAPENLMPACNFCNRQKKDKLVEEFRSWIMLDQRRVRTGAPNFTAEQINWLMAKGFNVLSGLEAVVFHFEKNPSIWLPLPREYQPVTAERESA